MQQLDCLTKLLGIQGFRVSGIEIRQTKGIDTVVIDLQRECKEYICSGCGKEVSSKHSSWTQQVRHLHLWRYLTILRIQKVKVRCPRCGVKVERIGFLDSMRRQTAELTHQVSELCKAMSIEDVAKFEQLHWQTVKDIDNRAIEKAQSERALEGITEGYNQKVCKKNRRCIL